MQIKPMNFTIFAQIIVAEANRNKSAYIKNTFIPILSPSSDGHKSIITNDTILGI